MFLDKLRERNPDLVEFAKEAFNDGRILPNSYILDLDAITNNANLLKEEADKFNIQVFQMTKQFGRNPIVAKAIASQGIEKAVCVDFEEALILMKHGIKIGNVGHLVQTPTHALKKILSAQPEVMTIFGFEKAAMVNKAAQELNLHQEIILKVYADNDIIYKGQDGGIHIQDLEEQIKQIKTLSNLTIVGFTSFPAFLYDGTSTTETNNLHTINKAVEIGQRNGLNIKHVNMPSANSVNTLKDISRFGGTHAEPGHALTGTMPINSKKNMAEMLAIMYVSEVSHFVKDKAYFYGGGHYRRGHFENIVVVNKNIELDFKVNEFDPHSIDYYLNFDHNKQKIYIGDLVMGSFRTQIFVTRAKVVVVKGLSQGNPKIVGTYSSQGDLIEWM